MTSGVPWHMKGVRREVVDSAREAARRAGMSVEEWLDTVIAESARNAGIEPGEYRLSDFEIRPAAAESPDTRAWQRNAPEREERTAPNFSEVRARLDSLSRQLDTLAQVQESRQQQALHRPANVDDTPRLIAEAVSRLDRKIDRLVEDGLSANQEIERRMGAIDRAVAGSDPGPNIAGWLGGADPLDQAMAEIATRQRMLDDTGATAPAADLPRAPTQRLPDLEQLLREINTRIEVAGPAAIDGAVETLRNDLAEIALMVRDAMPRQAIEALETEIRSLASRIDSQRQDGSDRAAIAVIERGLADIRGSLRTLTPAESLVGFDRTVQGLSQKIDRIADIGQNHPEVLKQLEGAILALRGTIAHVASNDALSQLTKEVRALSGKIDQVAAPEAFSGMERRIAAIADALQQSRNAPIQDAAGLESAVLGLADKVDRLQSSQSDRALIQDLQERIARLAEKLDTSDARLNHLGSIESALADLLVQMERRNPAEANAGGASANADALKRDVQRTQNSIESLHGTLAQVVDRLATIEASIAKSAQSRAPAAPNVPTQHAPSLRVALGPELLSSPSITPTQTAGSSVAAFAPRGADRRAIDPTLPPNHPLEPGGQFRAGHSAAERIAASEAALEEVLPQAVSDPGGRSDFIAAARRAAQAAMAAPQREKRSAVAWSDDDAQPRSGGVIRKLAIAASITLFILGAVHFGLNRYWGGMPTVNSTAQVIPDDAPLDPPQIAAPATLDQQSVALPPTVATPPRAPGNEASAPPSPAIPVPNLDTTGTVRQPTMQAASLPPVSSPPVSTARTHDPDRQTPASGGVGLRAAADNGDPAAAFELASRYADGRGMPQDLAEAAAWFERAANKGFVPAQFRLGSLYEKGIGVRKNLDTARRFYTAAAEAGHAKAMHNLAVLYAEGVEGKPNYAMAARWFRKAADHGVADSQYNLAILYARGIGVETNLAEAFKWFALASRDGDHDAGKKRDDIASRLDKKSLTAAMAAARAWQPVPQPESAIDASAPPGGWDAAPATTAKRGGPKANVQSRRPTQ